MYTEGFLKRNGFGLTVDTVTAVLGLICVEISSVVVCVIIDKIIFGVCRGRILHNRIAARRSAF